MEKLFFSFASILFSYCDVIVETSLKFFLPFIFIVPTKNSTNVNVVCYQHFKREREDFNCRCCALQTAHNKVRLTNNTRQKGIFNAKKN